VVSLAPSGAVSPETVHGRGQLKCDGIRAETTFRLSVKETTLIKSAAGVSSVD